MSQKRNTELSATMIAALAGAKLGDGTLIRHPGGYWTYANCQCSSGLPDWHVGTTTINALIARDAVRVLERQQGRSREFPIRVEILVPPAQEHA